MMKNKLNFLIALIATTFLLISSVSAITMTRSVPSTAPASGSFTVTYTVSGGTGSWGASIVDTASGNCKFPDGTNQLKTVMLSSDGLTKTVIVTAPASGSCTFTGDYKFGTDAIVNFPTATVTIGGTCTPSCTCAANTCIGTTCSNGCGGTCQGTKTGCEIIEPTCPAFFSETMNWYSFTDTPCTNGYIITGILVLIGLFAITKILK